MVRRKSKRDEDTAEQKLRKIHDRERKYLYDEVTTSPDKVDDLVNEQMNGAEEKGEDGEEDEEDEEDEDEEDEEDEDEDDDDDEDVDVRGDEDEDEDEDDEEMRELETLENQENANNFFEMAEQETTAQDQQPRAKDDDFLNPGNENEHIQQVRRGLRDRTKSLTTIKGWCDDLMGRRRQRIVNEDIENGTTEGDEQSTDDIEAEAGTDSSEERFESNENIVGNDSQASSSSTSNRTVQTTRNTKDGRNKKTKKKEIREMVNRINNDHDYKQTFETVRDSKTVVWKDGAKNDFTDQFNPAEEPGIHADVYDKDPLELFELMWNNEVMDAWLYNSNIKGYILYGNSKSGWKEISIGEGYIFLAITLSLGLSPKRRLKDYWQKNNLYGSIFCRSHMSRFRFLQILGASTFVENELELGDGGKGNIASSSFSRTWKIDNMTNLLIKQFQTYYRAGRRICIDESMIKFTGRFTWKQHIPRKPIKDGIKIWALNCGESKYLLNFIIYAAQTWSRSTGPGSLIFGTMWALITGENCPFAKSLINEGRILAGDSLFSMVGAVLALLKARVYYVGTIGKNRGLDEEQISGRIVGINGVRRKMKRGEAKFFTDDEKKIQMVVWKDTGLVKMVSTVPELSTDMVTTSRKLEKLVDNRKVTTSEVISMPEILKEFNISKGGTDIFNQYVATNHTQMKTRFWPRPVFIWGIEASAVNCYILANLAEKDKWNSRSFRQCLINGLIKKGLAQLGRNDPQRPLGNQPIRHVNIWMGPNYKSNLIPRMRSPPRWFDMKNLRLNKKITHVCGRGNSLNLCIVHKQIKKTSIICMQCMVPLCLENCWYNWHNVMDYIFDDPLRQNVRTMRTTSTH